MHDTGAKGMPDLSYHGRKAWYGDFEGGSRHVGILYAGCHTGGETLYVVCNMHTTSQELALPTLPSGEFWSHCRYRMRGTVLFPGRQGAGAGRGKDCESGSADNYDYGR